MEAKTMSWRQLLILGLIVSTVLTNVVPATAKHTAVRFHTALPVRHSPTQDDSAAMLFGAWDDADSHKWIPEDWGDTIETDYTEFENRKVLRAKISATDKNWAVIRTDAFPSENWEGRTGLRANIYQAGGARGTDVKLEVRGPEFDEPHLIDSIYCHDLQRNAWNTCTWKFAAQDDYADVAHLSIVFDHLGGKDVTFYVDDIRLVSTSHEEEWDDMDDGSAEWFYFGNWYNWNPNTPFGLEPISHNGGNPVTPAGSVYLQWDYENGCCHPLTTAELGTTKVDELGDWNGINRLTADVRVTDPDVPISVFFWDAEGSTDPIDCRGFGSPTRKAGAADTWRTLTWDLPWPPCFDNTAIDEIKFVANGIEEYQRGNLFLDNIFFVADMLPPPLQGLPYVFEDFNDQDRTYNDFSGNWGELNGEYVATTFVPNTHAGTWGSSLRIDYSLPSASLTGVVHSLWGHSDYTQTQFIDFTDIYGDLNEADRDFEQIHFWIRGSGDTQGTHNVKVELKDNSGSSGRTAYRYIAIDDADTTWRKVVLDADVTNASFWSYTDRPPDPTKMKQMVFVIESCFNHPNGTFYIDDIHFVDADDVPFNLDLHTDDEFLDFVSKKTFQYFLDWYDPNTGLFQDRSTFPDVMSTAATGFGLTALAIGESRGWIDRPHATQMVARTLQALYQGQSPSDTVTDVMTGTNGYRGFFYHFLDNDGARKFDNEGVGSELSPIDTAILVAGILTAREHFSDVQEIVSLADAIYARVEWSWMLNPDSDWFYLAWKPEADPKNGYDVEDPDGGYFSKYLWDYYTDEAILINLLAIGSPAHPVSQDVFHAWKRRSGAYGGHTLRHSWNGSLFTYVFAHLWVDFRFRGEDNHPSQPVDWWSNSVEAAWANWQFTVDHHDDTPCDGDDDYTTYGVKSWGLTAADGPYDEESYRAYGAQPVDPATDVDHDGTIAPYGAGMATMLLPEKSIPALKHYFEATDLWRYRFGYGDAYSLDPPDCNGPWYNRAAFGIDQGPMLIGIENHRSGLIWNTMKRNSSIRDALCSIVYCSYGYLPLIAGSPQ
jgi:hypothetical protein